MPRESAAEYRANRSDRCHRREDGNEGLDECHHDIRKPPPHGTHQYSHGGTSRLEDDERDDVKSCSGRRKT